MKTLATMLAVAVCCAAPTLAQNTAPAPAQPAAAAPAAVANTSQADSTRVSYVPIGASDTIAKALQAEAGEKYTMSVHTYQNSQANQGRTYVELRISGTPAPTPALVYRLKQLSDQMVLDQQPVQKALQETIDIDFAGGTTADFIKALLPANLPINIIYGPNEAEKLPLPALRARQLSRFSALDLMKKVQQQSMQSDGQFEFEWVGGYNTDAGQERQTLMITRQSTHGGRTPANDMAFELEPLVLRISPANATSQEARREQEAKQKEILMAIDDGLLLRGGPSKNFKTKLNAATGIMFVQGSNSEKDLVTKVVNAMKVDWAPQAAPTSTPAPAGRARTNP